MCCCRYNNPLSPSRCLEKLINPQGKSVQDIKRIEAHTHTRRLVRTKRHFKQKQNTFEDYYPSDTYWFVFLLGILCFDKKIQTLKHTHTTITNHNDERMKQTS